MVKLVVEDGLTFERAAARSNVAKSTCWEWVSRWRAATSEERASLACLADRSSRPRCSPRLLDGEVQAQICKVRQATGWGPRLVAGCVGRHHSSVWKVLHRHGLSRLPRPDRGESNRYEWPCPGDMLHIDVSHYARFERPGHRVTGDRSSTSAEKDAALGYEFGHACVDDHTRLAFAQIRDDERSPSVTAFVADCLAFYRSHGIQTRRILTDNAWSYTHNRSLRELLAAESIEHWTIRPRRPQTNGKVCVLVSGCRPVGRRGSPRLSV